MTSIQRQLVLPPAPTETFFLWGARQSGKSTLLRQSYPGLPWIDLLKADVLRRYATNPEFLRQELDQSGGMFVVIDEIQKVPALLDEVHWLHENRGINFALCGSSARKLKRGHGNLLGGRGARYSLYGFSARELGANFDLERMLNQGGLPRIYFSDRPTRLLNAYVADYLKEEVMAEGLVRKLPPFSNFLHAAALCDTQQVNFTNISRELGVSRETVRGYFGVLEDTLIGEMLPSFRLRPKRRVVAADKFYFSDVGVANFLAQRGGLSPGSELYGKAFENWVLHELRCYNAYRERFARLAFWRLSSGIEVDFIINQLECAIEAKSSARIREDHLKGLRELMAEYPETARRLVVCREPGSRRTPDGIEIHGVESFIGKLWSGDFF
jgi:predicted AAA+ superfamily ATPase